MPIPKFEILNQDKNGENKNIQTASKAIGKKRSPAPHGIQGEARVYRGLAIS